MFPVFNSMALVWGGVGQALVQFMLFSAIFAMLVFCRPRWPRGTHSEGCEWGHCDNICLLGYERAFFAVSSPAEALQTRAKDAK